MKKIHIVGIILIIVAIGALILLLGGNSSYADFSQAMKSPDSEFHIVGKYNKAKPAEYMPEINTDEFKFYLIDAKGLEKQVVLHKPKPQDFDASEQIVVIGKMENDVFHANDILLKCPSKYNNGTPEVKG